MTEIQGVLFYTQEDVDTKVSELETASNMRVVRELAMLNDKISDGIVSVLKGEVVEGNMTLEYANELYDKFCDNVGLVRKEITNTYEVTVYYEGNEVGTFSGVEARDEDSACEEVENNLDVDGITLTFQFSYNGDTNYAEIERSAYDFDTSDFSFEANEE